MTATNRQQVMVGPITIADSTTPGLPVVFRLVSLTLG